MEQWIPLIVAVVAGLTAVGVAVWNSRGESAALRHLKAMNEVLKDLPAGEHETKSFERSRNALAARVAARVMAPPTWLRAVWIICFVLYFGFAFVWAFALTGQLGEEARSFVAPGIGIALLLALAGSLAWAVDRRNRRAAREEGDAQRPARKRPDI